MVTRMNNMITGYFRDLLQPELATLGVNDEFIRHLLRVVYTQMSSALRHWNDVRFRNTLMLLVSEEAPFYQPEKASLAVRSFVVLTLRNSPFESLQSRTYAQTGLLTPLSVSQITHLTKNAVTYFDRFNFTDMQGTDGNGCSDIYLQLAQAYPVAWNALQELANCPKQSCDFEPMSNALRVDPVFNSDRHSLGTAYTLVRKDGYDETPDEGLIDQVQFCRKNGMALFSDCFKMISRNPMLVLRVLEYLLANRIPYVSTNYYIANGHAEKRKHILKAAHNQQEADKHLTDLRGISPMHREILTSVKASRL